MKFFVQSVANTQKLSNLGAGRIVKKRKADGRMDQKQPCIQEDSVDISHLSTLLRKIISSEYGEKILDAKLMCLSDMETIADRKYTGIGLLSWIVSEQGFDLLEKGHVTPAELKTLKTIGELHDLFDRVETSSTISNTPKGYRTGPQ